MKNFEWIFFLNKILFFIECERKRGIEGGKLIEKKNKNIHIKKKKRKTWGKIKWEKFSIRIHERIYFFDSCELEFNGFYGK